MASQFMLVPRTDFERGCVTLTRYNYLVLSLLSLSSLLYSYCALLLCPGPGHHQYLHISSQLPRIKTASNTIIFTTVITFITVITHHSYRTLWLSHLVNSSQTRQTLFFTNSWIQEEKIGTNIYKITPFKGNILLKVSYGGNRGFQASWSNGKNLNLVQHCCCRTCFPVRW